jgi:septal ring factor EnvC (AmiA/AmiB activator)
MAFLDETEKVARRATDEIDRLVAIIRDLEEEVRQVRGELSTALENNSDLESGIDSANALIDKLEKGKVP